MLSSAEIKSLKQVNVSENAAKTKKRLKEDFSSASNENKAAIVELSGQKRSSFYRAYEKGAVNARLVLAMSQILNVSPFYYTGEEDVKLPLSNSTLISFLKKHGYNKIDGMDAAEEPEAPQKRKYTRKQKPQPEKDDFAPLPDESEFLDEEEDSDETVNIQLTFADSPEMRKALAEIDEEDAILLLRALLRREKAGGAAGQIAELVKRCLLS